MNDQTFPSMFEAAEWQQYARCGNSPIDGDPADGVAPMFPADGDAEGIAYAKTFCAACPVQLECLAGAMERGEQYGVWGGFTTEERKLLRRRKQRSGQSVQDISLNDIA